MGLFHVCFDKPNRDAEIWSQRDGNSGGEQGMIPMNVPQARIDQKLREITLQIEK